MAITSATTILRHINAPGYVLDVDTFRQIDELSREVVTADATNARAGDGGPKPRVAHRYHSRLGNVWRTFIAIDDFLKECDTRNPETSIEIEHAWKDGAGVTIKFDKDGRVEISAFGSAPDFEYRVSRLTTEIEGLGKQHIWPVQAIFLTHRGKFQLIAIGLVLGIYVATLGGVVGLLQTHGVAAEITDTTVVLPTADEYYKEASEAIHADSVRDKLDALLLGQMKDLATPVRRNQRARSFLHLVGIAGGVIFAVAGLYFLGLRLFPKANIILSKDATRRHDRRLKLRDVYFVGLVLAFLVNIGAGVVLLLFQSH